LSALVRVSSAGEWHDLYIQDFPVALAAEESEDGLLVVGEAAEPRAVAWLGQTEGNIFIQPVEGAPAVHLNGRLLAESTWIREGHTLTMGPTFIDVVRRDAVLTLAAAPAGQGGTRSGRREADKEPSAMPPEAVVPPMAPIRPIRKPRTPAFRAAVVILIVLVMGVAFVIAASPVRVMVSPHADSVSFRGRAPVVPIAGRYLVLPGRYVLVAEKEGYRRLEREITVAFGSEPVLEYKLLERPGYLDVISQPITSAAVTIDGKAVGNTPLKSLEIEPGRHELRVVAPRHRAFSETIHVHGKGATQTIDVVLLPASGTLEINSEPPAAEVRLNGTEVGVTPLRTEPAAGRYHVEVRKSGWKPASRVVRINVNETVRVLFFRLEKGEGRGAGEAPAPAVARGASDARPVQVEPPQRQALAESPRASAPAEAGPSKAEGTLTVTTSPPDATVTVNGETRGSSPVTLTLALGRDHKMTVHKAGFETATRTVSGSGDGPRTLHIDLGAQYGIVFISTRPAGATLAIDGKPSGSASQRLRLPTAPHRLDIAKPGYAPHSVTVTPTAEVSKSIEVTRERLGESPAAPGAGPTQTASGQALRLIRLSKPFRFQMGAPRSEAGRRSNEAAYWVELTRSFYIGAKEVTNKEFQAFNPQHNSGHENGVDLNGPDQPVVAVSWDDAARYVNWLSKRDGLPAAYREADGKMVAIQPPTIGYRLPTEAEWAFAARHEGGSRAADQPLKFAWEGGMPPAAGSGNYADETASGRLPVIIRGYSDGSAASAPAGRYSPNRAGIFDLGGNVSEWIHDYYDVQTGSGDAALRDPMGPAAGTAHVVRGSSWRHGSITELRLSYRDSALKPRNDLGFRVARYVADTPQ
jgi:formylglycine-generating enzyme required for sulfatase activity